MRGEGNLSGERLPLPRAPSLPKTFNVFPRYGGLGAIIAPNGVRGSAPESGPHFLAWTKIFPDEN